MRGKFSSTFIAIFRIDPSRVNRKLLICHNHTVDTNMMKSMEWPRSARDFKKGIPSTQKKWSRQHSSSEDLNYRCIMFLIRKDNRTIYKKGKEKSLTNLVNTRNSVFHAFQPLEVVNRLKLFYSESNFGAMERNTWYDRTVSQAKNRFAGHRCSEMTKSYQMQCLQKLRFSSRSHLPQGIRI